MINLFTIFTFHMNFWRAHGNYILKITLCPFLKKIVILSLCQVAPYLTYWEHFNEEFPLSFTCSKIEWKHQNDVLNLLKVNKDTRTTRIVLVF